jgi:hypothetical protein
MALDEEAVEVTSHPKELGYFFGIGLGFHRWAEDNHVHWEASLFAYECIFYLND